jgi:outer membrane protein insertion porin family
MRDLMKIQLLLLSILLLVTTVLNGAEKRRIDDIRVQGLERVSKGAVYAHLPLDIGDTFDPEQSAAILRSLYKSEFFEDIQLGVDGSALIIKVKERPSIAKISIEGNSDIETDALLDGLAKAGIEKGRVFNRSVLENIERELRQQYFSQGKYNVRIDSEKKKLEGNRVELAINISEGVVTKIQRVEIVGNQLFSDAELTKDFNSGKPSWWAVFSSRDNYAKQKLEADLEILRSFYLDRGYLNFNIDSTQVTLTPDKKDLYITINVTEGDKFSIANVALLGDLKTYKTELLAAIGVKENQVFSRAKISDSIKKMKDVLGADGFAFANINVVPEINNAEHSADIKFVVDPGKRVYVRKISFFGNAKTRDEVFRREMRQLEGAWYSAPKVNRSKVRIQRLAFVETVNIESKRVPDHDDLVDLEVTVTERLAGSFSAAVGYSQNDQLIVNLSFNQDNAFGTGKQLAVTAQNTSATTQYSISYTNPYHTLDGISRGINAFYRTTDTSELGSAAFINNRFGLGVTYGIPLTEYDRLRFNLSYERIEIETGSSTPQSFITYLDENGSEFNEYILNSTFTHDTRNRTVFATEGNLQRINLEVAVPGSDLEYYKLGYRAVLLYPFAERFALQLMGDTAYGDNYSEQTTGLPFFENYFAGGIRSVRGYRTVQLGPRDAENDRAIGGSFRTLASAELFFPAPFARENRSIRMGAFVDAGNVFDGIDNFDANELRAAAGISFEWLSPVGPLVFSWADALNAESGDKRQQFQFSVGGTF